MGVAMVAVFAVVLARGVARNGVIGMHAVMVVMSVHVKADRRDVVPDMPIRAHRRRPSDLERDHEHDDEGDGATHGWDCTEPAVSSNRNIEPGGVADSRRGAAKN